MSIYKGGKRVAGRLCEINDVYSTEETKTDKIWIDGKPIYRKVVTANSFNYTLNIPIPDLKEVVNIVHRRRFDARALWLIGGSGNVKDYDSNYLTFSYTTEGITILNENRKIVYSYTGIIEYTKNN